MTANEAKQHHYVPQLSVRCFVFQERDVAQNQRRKTREP